MKFLIENQNLVFSPNLNQHRPTFILERCTQLQTTSQVDMDSGFDFASLRLVSFFSVD